jgi:hypothetical protein
MTGVVDDFRQDLADLVPDLAVDRVMVFAAQQ